MVFWPSCKNVKLRYFLMSRKTESKFKIFANKEQSKINYNEPIPFFPKYETSNIFREILRLTWFEANFSQSRYNFAERRNGSNACTLIAILTAANCFFNQISIEEPEKPINHEIIHALANGILLGNTIHENLKAKCVLSNINLTVPEAIKYSGEKVAGIREWKSVLFPQSLALTLFENLKHLWLEWRYYCQRKKKYPDLYVVLISDTRTVLFIIQEKFDTVSLVDSHQHSQDRGAFIATVYRNKLKILCHWFSDLIYRCYESYPNMYELSLLYFRNNNKSKKN